MHIYVYYTLTSSVAFNGSASPPQRSTSVHAAAAAPSAPTALSPSTACSTTASGGRRQ